MVDTIVCMKVVPRPEEVRVDEETKTLDRRGIRSMINPPDMNALEMAIHLRERYGGTVTLLSMGPPDFESYLRVGLEVGADDAVLLSDRAFAGADTLATSYTLSRGLQKIGRYDIILCGEESSDGATGQVPPGIAEWLDIPQVTYVTGVDILDGHARAKRELKGGHEVIEVPLPSVMSVVVGANEPRFISYERAEWASSHEIRVWNAGEIGAEDGYIGFAGSGTTVSALRTVRTRERRREFIRGEDAARQLHARIKEIIEV